MKQLFLLTLFIILAPQACFGQTKIFLTIVEKQNGKPVQAPEIRLFWEDSLLEDQFSIYNKQWIIELPDSTMNYTLRIGREGFTGQQITIPPSREKKQSMFVELERLPEPKKSKREFLTGVIPKLELHHHQTANLHVALGTNIASSFFLFGGLQSYKSGSTTYGAPRFTMAYYGGISQFFLLRTSVWSPIQHDPQNLQFSFEAGVHFLWTIYGTVGYQWQAGAGSIPGMRSQGLVFSLGLNAPLL